jgi:hypothetical protein
MTPYDVAKGLLTDELAMLYKGESFFVWLFKSLFVRRGRDEAREVQFVDECAAEADHERAGRMTARSWLSVGEKVAIVDAKRGDLVVAQIRDGEDGRIGFLDFYDRRRGLIYLLGQQGGEVCISSVPLKRLLGVRRLRSLDKLQGTTSRVL